MIDTEYREESGRPISEHSYGLIIETAEDGYQLVSYLRGLVEELVLTGRKKRVTVVTS